MDCDHERVFGNSNASTGNESLLVITKKTKYMRVCDNTSVKHCQQSQYQWLRAQATTLSPAENKHARWGLKETRLVLWWDHGGERHLVDTACTIATVYSVVAL